MTKFESILIWTPVYFYAFATLILLAAFVFKKERPLRWAGHLILSGFVLHTAELLLRWIRTGYIPASGDYESALVGGWFAMAFTVYLYFGKRQVRGVAMITVPFTLIFLGFGMMKSTTQMPVVASLKTSWLVIHVLFAQLCFGAYAVAAGLGIIYLLKDNKEKKGQESAFFNRFPALPILEELMFKFVIYGFIAMAVEIAAGSIWAKDLWGSYWSWDPVEIWSLVSWLTYGIVMHLKITLAWKGRKLAWLCAFAMVFVVIAFWGVDLMVEQSHRFFGMEGEVGGSNMK